MSIGNPSATTVKTISAGWAPRLAPRAEKRSPTSGTIEDNRQKFEAVMFPHLDAAYNLARWITGNERDATRVLEDSYKQAFREFDRCQGDEFKTWLLSIVHNAAHACLRAQETVTSAAEQNRNKQGRSGGRNRLRGLIEQLPPACREVFVMRELEQMSYQQIAVVSGLSIETVVSRLSIARDCLAQRLLGSVAV